MSNKILKMTVLLPIILLKEFINTSLVMKIMGAVQKSSWGASFIDRFKKLQAIAERQRKN